MEQHNSAAGSVNVETCGLFRIVTNGSTKQAGVSTVTPGAPLQIFLS